MKNITPIGIFFLMILIGCQSEQASMLSDQDGNHYSVKKYGETIWMTENLKVRQDKSGKSIKHYFPNDDSSNIQDFGLLYDFESACKACPDGWRLPENEDWEKFLSLNGGYIASNYKDSLYWKGEVNENTSQFSVRPTGSGNNGEYPNHFSSKTLFWSKTKEDEHFVWTYIFEKGKDSLRVASQHPTYAFAVRCIKGAAE